MNNILNCGRTFSRKKRIPFGLNHFYFWVSLTRIFQCFWYFRNYFLENFLDMFLDSKTSIIFEHKFPRWISNSRNSDFHKVDSEPIVNRLLIHDHPNRQFFILHCCFFYPPVSHEDPFPTFSQHKNHQHHDIFYSASLGIS